MNIAVVSTIYQRTPPAGYGGIERVVHILVEELVRQGHDVTMFATPGSECSGRTVGVEGYDDHTSRAGIGRPEDILSEEPLYEAVKAWAGENPVDVVHDWSFMNLFPRRHPDFPFVVSVCLPGLPEFMGEPFTTNRVASCAAHARQLGGTTRFVRYGLPLDRWTYSFDKADHLVHIAKIMRIKGQHDAILAARKAHRKLLVVGNVFEKLYFWTVVKPLVAVSPTVRFVGETGDTNTLLKEAAALVQTPKWFDAFPLVVLESLASGTPVLAYDQGGLAEQIENGVNGFLCRDVGELAEAMRRVDEIRPRTCREYAEEHFSVARMAEEYVALYERAIDGDRW